MPHAKFRANPLKTVAVHKEQKTDRHTHILLYPLMLNDAESGDDLLKKKLVLFINFT